MCGFRRIIVENIYLNAEEGCWDVVCRRHAEVVCRCYGDVKDTPQTPQGTWWGAPVLWSLQRTTSGKTCQPLDTHTRAHTHTHTIKSLEGQCCQKYSSVAGQMTGHAVVDLCSSRSSSSSSITSSGSGRSSCSSCSSAAPFHSFFPRWG